MTFRAVPRVQVIGHTKFISPVDGDGIEIMVPHADATDSESLIEFAGRACYQSFDRPSSVTATIDGYLRNIFQQKHFSVVEHGSVSVYIEGISRSCSHEVVRHRHMSFSQLSQRFVDESTLKIVVPPAIEEHYGGEQGAIEAWAEREGRDAILKYEQEIERLTSRNPDKTRKQVRETARSVLPNATETRMVLTGNYRSWLEFIDKRDAAGADAEICRLAQMIHAELKGLAPHIFGNKARQILRAAQAQ